jgi:hypothetical protein
MVITEIIDISDFEEIFDFISISESAVLSTEVSDDIINLVDNHLILGAEVDQNALVVIDVSSFFKYRGIKLITWLEFLGEGTGTFSFAIDYKMSAQDTWHRTSYIETNNQGSARVNIAGTHLRIVLKNDDYSTMKLSQIRVVFNAIDVRYKRGLVENA